MNSIIDWAVRSTRLIIAMVIVVVIAGVAAFITIPKEADPDISVPIIYVSIVHQGISPEDAERLLIKPMEAQLRSIEGVKKMTSIGSQGHAAITLEFDINFDKEKALQDVRAKVDIARAELPEEAEEPTVHEVNVALFPVITVALSGEVDERALLKIAKDLEDRIEAIPSVLGVDLVGQREELLEVIVDPAKMEGYGLTQSELFTAVRMNNQLIAAGQLDTGRGSFAVKVPGLFETRQDVLGLVLRANDKGGVVTLGDVADIRSTFYDATTYSQYNGKPSISLEVTKRIGENIIETNKLVRAVVAEAKKSWPAGVNAAFALDESDWINQSLGSLSDSIVLAVVLVMIIVVAALGLRSGLLVGFAIPTSFLISFFLLQMWGYTLNMMIMFGMLLAVGILVDGAIIVVEYADRKMAEGLTPKEAFANAAKRMFWPVTSATGTMLAAFLPMLLWPGMTGKFMSYFPITLIVILAASLVVALIFLPVIGGLFGRRQEYDQSHVDSIEASETGDWRKITGVTGAYAHLVSWVTRHPGLVVIGVIVLAVSVGTLFWNFNPGQEYFVKTDPSLASVTVSARGNLSASEKRDLVFEVEKAILPIDGIESVMTTSGGGGNQGRSFGDRSVAEDTIGQVFVQFKDYRLRRKGTQILEEIREKTKHFAGIRVEIHEQQQGPPTGKAISIELGSDDIQALLEATQKVRAHLDSMPELRDVEDTRPLPGIEWALQIDREQAGRFGADVMTVGTAVQLVTNGIKIGEYRPDDSDDEVDIRVRYPLEARGINALDTLRVTTKGGSVPISNFVARVPQQQVNQITRVDGHRIYRLRANVPPDVLPTTKVKEIQDWIKTAGLPSDVVVLFRGANEQQDESAGFLLFFAIPAALFMIFAILLAMFNSVWHAFLIIIAAMMAVFGALLGSVVMQQPLSIIMSGTGILALIGIVVNHNIVLIDTYHRLIDTGMDRTEAVIRSSAQRLRPVFLTTLTAVLGLFPMMLAIEINFVTREVMVGAPAALWWVALSTAIVFGLVFSKLITLGLTPALLAWPLILKPRFAWIWRFAKGLVAGLDRQKVASAAAATPDNVEPIKTPHREAAE